MDQEHLRNPPQGETERGCGLRVKVRVRVRVRMIVRVRVKGLGGGRQGKGKGNRERKREGKGGGDPPQGAYLTPSVLKVVLHKSTHPQIRQLILYHY